MSYAILPSLSRTLVAALLSLVATAAVVAYVVAPAPARGGVIHAALGASADRIVYGHVFEADGDPASGFPV